MVVAQSHSKELTAFGIPVGHKNYAAGYACGLLTARRLLKKFGLDEKFEGKTEVDGEEYHVEDEEDEDERKPFKAIVDVGLHVPHKQKKFPGYEPAEDKGGEPKYDAE